MASSSENTVSLRPECQVCFEPYSLEGEHSHVTGGVADCTHIVCLQCFNDMPPKKVCPFDRIEWRVEPVKHLGVIEVLTTCIAQEKIIEELTNSNIAQEKIIGELTKSNQHLAETVKERDATIQEAMARLQSVPEKGLRDPSVDIDALQHRCMKAERSNEELLREIMSLRAQLASHSPIAGPSSSVPGPSSSTLNSFDCISDYFVKNTVETLLNNDRVIMHSYGLKEDHIIMLKGSYPSIFELVINKLHANLMAFHTDKYDHPDKYKEGSFAQVQYNELIKFLGNLGSKLFPTQIDAIPKAYRGYAFEKALFGGAPNLPEALRFYHEAWEQNPEDPWINYKLGSCYRLGRGVAKNIELALMHLQKSAEKEYCRGQGELGYLYLDEPTKYNPDLGEHYLVLATLQGDAIAMRRYGEILIKRPGTELEGVELISRSQIYR